MLILIDWIIKAPTSVKFVISKVVEASQPMPFHSEKSLHIHKVLFEYLVSDCVPWNAINGPGFQRLCHELNPRFQVASESYYRSLLDPTFEKLKEKLKDKIKSDNPATNAISLDGWSENHEGIDSITLNSNFS